MSTPAMERVDAHAADVSERGCRRPVISGHASGVRSSYGSKLAVTRSRADSEVDGDGHGISGNHDSPSASRSRSESAASVSLCQIRFEVTVGDAALVIGGVVVAVSVQPCCLVLGGVHDSHGMKSVRTGRSNDGASATTEPRAAEPSILPSRGSSRLRKLRHLRLGDSKVIIVVGGAVVLPPILARQSGTQ